MEHFLDHKSSLKLYLLDNLDSSSIWSLLIVKCMEMSDYSGFMIWNFTTSVDSLLIAAIYIVTHIHNHNNCLLSYTYCWTCFMTMQRLQYSEMAVIQCQIGVDDVSDISADLFDVEQTRLSNKGELVQCTEILKSDKSYKLNYKRYFNWVKFFSLQNLWGMQWSWYVLGFTIGHFLTTA